MAPTAAAPLDKPGAEAWQREEEDGQVVERAAEHEERAGGQVYALEHVVEAPTQLRARGNGEGQRGDEGNDPEEVDQPEAIELAALQGCSNEGSKSRP